MHPARFPPARPGCYAEPPGHISRDRYAQQSRRGLEKDGERLGEEPKDVDNDYLNGCRTVSEILRSRFHRSGERGRTAEQVP
jgi:hypothetical protein